MGFIRLLERLYHTLDLFKITSCRQWIVNDGTDDAFRVNDKDCTYCLCTGYVRLQHPIFCRNLGIQVRDHRKIDLHIFHALPFQFFDLSDPGNVGIERIHRQSQKFYIHLLKFFFHGCHRHKLSGANRGKIRGMGKEKNPFSFVILREIHSSICC